MLAEVAPYGGQRLDILVVVTRLDADHIRGGDPQAGEFTQAETVRVLVRQHKDGIQGAVPQLLRQDLFQPAQFYHLFVIHNRTKNHFIHFAVPRFGRHSGDILFREAHPDLVGLQLRQQSVIIPFAAAQTVAGSVESYPRHDRQVDERIVEEGFAGRLQDVECSLPHALHAFVGPDLQRVAYDNGQQNMLFSVPFLHEGMGIHLVR